MSNFFREWFPTLLFAVPAAALWWFLPSQPAANAQVAGVRWQITEVNDIDNANALARQGWEPYAANYTTYRTVYFLRRRF